jgi:cyclophilin family peptidyl-prolyl cis-trans isomerase
MNNKAEETMRLNSLVLLLSICAMFLMAGCPRDTNTESSGAEVSSNPITAEVPDSVATSAAGTLDTDASDEAQDVMEPDDDMAEGEDAENEQTAGEEADETMADDAKDSTEADMDEPGAEMTDEMDKGDVTMVVLETSKGDVVLEVHADWSPLGAEHFLELVKAGFYDGAPWFRVFKDPMGISVAQCGIAADPEVTAQWQQKTIMDEPVVMGNMEGTVAFGKSQMPNSRSTHIFVNLSDNSRALDPQGFSCFAVIVEGYDIIDSLKETGASAVDQYQLSMQGIDYFYQVVPDGDIIKKAYIRE